jgi:hypothetical protein
MAARLAELGGAAEDITDPEDVVEQVVQPDAARGDVAAKVSRRKFDSMEAQVVDDLALDERQVAADACVAPVAGAGRVAVAEQPDCATCDDRVARDHRTDGGRGNVDGLDFSHQANLATRADST